MKTIYEINSKFGFDYMKFIRGLLEKSGEKKTRIHVNMFVIETKITKKDNFKIKVKYVN